MLANYSTIQGKYAHKHMHITEMNVDEVMNLRRVVGDPVSIKGGKGDRNDTQTVLIYES